jgi:DNA polymerase bacteriophage-type
MTAHVDFETRSDVPIDRGAYLYVRGSHFAPLCMAYAIGDEPVQLWAPGQPFPADLAAHIAAGGTLTAHNASFEIAVWERLVARLGWPAVPLTTWRCTMARARAMGFPGGLDAAAEAMGLAVRKDGDGSRLIKLLCIPTVEKKGKELSPATGDTAGGVRFGDDPAELKNLYAYCAQDVEVEREVCRRLPDLSPTELAVFHADLLINSRGVRIDVGTAQAAEAAAKLTGGGIKDEIRKVTWGICNTASEGARILAIVAALGYPLPDLRAQTVTDALDDDSLPPEARLILQVRQEGSKSSVAKLAAMAKAVSPDSRARELLQYHGADTARWSGRRVQPQNLPRTPDTFLDGSDFDGDRLCDLINAEDLNALRALCGTVSTACSWALRSLITAAPGHVLTAVDYSNIEGRVLAWQAGEGWKLDAFRAYDNGTGPDLYKLAYARSFDVAVSAVTKQLRQIGKVMELALGYQGGRGAFAQMAVNYGIRVVSDDDDATDAANTLTVSQVEEIKKRWREAHPETVALWRGMVDCAAQAVQAPGRRVDAGPVAFQVVNDYLLCRLPSGRPIVYPYPSIVRTAAYGWRQDAVTLAHALLEQTSSPPALRRAAQRLAAVAERAPMEGVAEQLRYTAGLAAEPYRANLHALADDGPRRMVPSLACYGRDKKIYDRAGKPKRLAWGRWYPYGGLLVENTTQAIARDLLAAAILRLENNGFRVVLHVHDEIVCEQPERTADLETQKQIMLEQPKWARGLPMAGDGWVGFRYRK